MHVKHDPAMQPLTPDRLMWLPRQEGGCGRAYGTFGSVPSAARRRRSRGVYRVFCGTNATAWDDDDATTATAWDDDAA